MNKACKFRLPQSGKTSFPPVRGPPVWQEAMAPNDVYIGRGSHKLRLARSIWHNPYKIDKGTSRTEAVRLFEEYVARSDHLRDFLRSLSGKRLRCHCLPRQQCHGDALVRCFVKYARGAHVPRLKVYEVFCGHAGLSEKIQAAGFDTVAIDWAGNRHKPRVPIRVSNLLEDVDVEKIIGDLRAGRVFFIWMAPPCGTFSKAREIPISKAAKANGVREPRPLRSASCPWGLPNLSAFEQSKVVCANILTRNTATIALAAYDANVPFVIENPPASHLWAMPCMQDVAELPGAFSTTFQACMYGGRRDKRTKLLATWGPAKNFCKMCDKGHTHLPWGVLLGARSEECEYPAGMCKEVARLLNSYAADLGYNVAPRPPRTRPLPRRQALRAELLATTGRQTKKYAGKLVPEYKSVLDVQQLEGKNIGALRRLDWIEQSVTADGVEIQPGTTRILETPQCKGEAAGGVEFGCIHRVRVEAEEEGADSRRGEKAQEEERGEVTSGDPGSWRLGLAWTPQEFLEEALKAPHPADAAPVLDPAMDAAVRWTATAEKGEIKRHLLYTLTQWRRRAEELQKREDALHAGMPFHRQQVLRGKRLLLLREMLASFSYPDLGIVADMAAGFRITGDLGVAGVFDLKAEDDLKDPVDVNWLWQNAREIREGIIRQLKEKQGCEMELQAELRRITLEEVKNGWAEGPFTESQVTKVLGPLWIPTRRFPVVQGPKVRPIDDLSENFVNSTAGIRELLDLMSVDTLVAVCKLWRTLRNDSDRHGEAGHLVGKRYDLTAAYKQCPLHEADSPFAVIAIGTGGEVEYFASRVLPFGASWMCSWPLTQRHASATSTLSSVSPRTPWPASLIGPSGILRAVGLGPQRSHRGS